MVHPAGGGPATGRMGLWPTSRWPFTSVPCSELTSRRVHPSKAQVTAACERDTDSWDRRRWPPAPRPMPVSEAPVTATARSKLTESTTV